MDFNDLRGGHGMVIGSGLGLVLGPLIGLGVGTAMLLGAVVGLIGATGFGIKPKL
jgi:hypothetical protein